MGNRGGNQCVGSEAKVLVRTKTDGLLEIPIKDVECMLNYFGGDVFDENLNYGETEMQVLTINGSYVTPLYKYKGDESIPVYRIIAQGPRPDKVHTLIATEWHPIMRNHSNVTFASLLSIGDSVLMMDGIGKVLDVQRIKSEGNTDVIEVYGLALGRMEPLEHYIPPAFDLLKARIKVTSDEEPSEEAIQTYLYLFATQMRNWSTFGLPLKENIIFTNSFATGGLAVQHQLSEILSNGINLNYFL